MMRAGVWSAALLAGAIFSLLCFTYARAEVLTSRVYVTAYPTCKDGSGNAIADPGNPTMQLHDQAYYGDPGDPEERGLTPEIHMQAASPPFIRFYFDLPAGSYDAFLRFTRTRKAGDMCGRNGPLIVLPNRSRSLFIGGSAVTDWHLPAAIAGTLPSNGIGVKVLLYDRPKRCGDDVHSYDTNTLKEIAPPQITRATIDDRAYYVNFRAYGTQDHTIALQFWGGLFTHGAVLVTNTPSTAASKPPFIIKDITAAVLQAAINSGDQLACVPGF